MWDCGPRDGCKDPGRLGPWAEGHNSPYTPPVGRVRPVGHPEKQGGRMLSCENIPAHRPPSTLPNLWAQTSDSHLRVLRPEVYFLSFPSFCGGTQSQLAGRSAGLAPQSRESAAGNLKLFLNCPRLVRIRPGAVTFLFFQINFALQLS